jgi:hypothetical protein
MAEGDAVLPNMYAAVTLVDRAMLGGCEIVYDGVRIVFKPGEIEKAVPQGTAEFLFQTQKEQVPLTGGGFAMRFGIKDPSEDLIATLGGECGNCDPIEIDTARLERWDVEHYAQRGGARKVVPVSRDPADYENLAQRAVTFGDQR